MLLSDIQIKNKNLVGGAGEEHYSSTTYNLVIDKIIDTEGKEYDTYDLPSGGIVEVVSREIINLPRNITGFAHVKTGMSSKGLLALNIGLVDPGWFGPLSTTLVNFGDHKGQLIQRGQTFLRIAFYEHEAPSVFKPVEKTKEVYEREKKTTFHRYFDSDFLSLDHHIRKKITEVSKSTFETRIAIFATMFVLLQMGLSFFLYSDPWKISRSADYVAASSSVQDTISHNIYIRDEIEALNQKIDEMEIEDKKQDRKRFLKIDRREEASTRYIKNLQERVKNLEALAKAIQEELQEAEK